MVAVRHNSTPISQNPKDEGGLWPAVVVLLPLALLYIMNAGQLSFWGENEAYYALGARSVLQGQWLLPHINHDLPVDKPPFAFWWVAAISALLGGVNEATARSANVVAAIATLAALFILARQRLGPWSALLSMIVLGTCYEFWENAREVNTDILLVGCLTVCWGALLDLMTAPHRRKTWWTLCAALAVATLTKGPVAPALTAAVAILFAVVHHGWKAGGRKLLELRPIRLCVVAAAPFIVWGTAVTVVYGFSPLRIILFQHNVERFVDAFDHQKPWFYYFRELPINLLPWTALLPLVGLWLGRRWLAARKKASLHVNAPQGIPDSRANELYAFTWMVIVVVFAFFSFSKSKRDYYLLPLMPWIAVLIGDFIWRLLLARAPFRARRNCGGLEFARLLLGFRYGRMLTAGVTLLMVGLACYAGIVAAMLEPRKSPRSFAATVDQRVDADDRLVVLDNQDPRLMYYVQEPIELTDDTEADLARLSRMLAGPGEFDVLVQDHDLPKFLEMGNVSLFVQERLTFGEDPYFLLTNAREDGAAPLLGLGLENVSGIVHHRARGTLFAVSDDGWIVEAEMGGHPIDRRQLGGDLEGLAYEPYGDWLYVADEEKSRILQVRPETLQIVKEYPLRADKELQHRPDGRLRLEGLCFAPGVEGGRLMAVHDDETALLLELEFRRTKHGEAAVAVAAKTLEGEDFSDLVATPGGRLLALTRKGQRLIELDRKGIMLRHWNLPGEEHAAVAALPGGELLVCEESGLLTRYSESELEATGIN